MQTSMTDPAAAPPAPTAGGCPPHAWITLRSLTSCSRCGQIDWTSSAPNLLPLALVSARALPDLWVAAPGETPAETAARDITDELLDEVADELADWRAAA